MERTGSKASEPRMRPAVATDSAAIAALVREAYAMYLPRMAKPPAPMLDDYDAVVSRGEATVLEIDGSIVGMIVLVDSDDHLLLENIAVAPRHKGLGMGRRLVAFAETEARRRGFPELRLYTHESMTENQALYAHIGFVETRRVVEDGYARIFMTKRV